MLLAVGLIVLGERCWCGFVFSVGESYYLGFCGFADFCSMIEN
jgi:hypothetical protein